MSATGVTGDPGGGLLPWLSLPESRLSGGFSVAPLWPRVGQPPPPPPPAGIQTENRWSPGRKMTGAKVLKLEQTPRVHNGAAFISIKF